MNEITNPKTVEIDGSVPGSGSGAGDHDALRARCKDVLEREDISQAELGRRLGLAPATFSAWYKRAYAGDNDRVAGQVRIGLDTLEARARAKHILPPDIGFVETPTAKKILTHLTFAHYAPDLVTVAAGAGCGKTMALKHYRATNANVWLATAEPSTKNVYPMLGAVADAMGIEEKANTRLSGAIKKFVAGKGGLLIVDEAQHLGTETLDQLRAIPDAVEVGLALVGNERVHARIEGGGRRAEFAQLFSRIGKSMTQGRPHVADVNALVAAWGIDGSEEKKMLRLIAAKGGALRSVSKVLRSAGMMAGGVDKIELKHIKSAFADLSHQTIEGSV